MSCSTLLSFYSVVLCCSDYFNCCVRLLDPVRDKLSNFRKKCINSNKVCLVLSLPFKVISLVVEIFYLLEKAYGIVKRLSDREGGLEGQFV